MTDTRKLSTAALASITTGKLLCPFAEMHQAAEFVMGHQIWTHHFADRTLVDDMKRTVLAQCPNLPSELDATPENWKEKLADLECRVGKYFRVSKGSGLTAMLPTDGIPAHLRNSAFVI